MTDAMSNLTGSANFLKYVLFAFNFFFVITGIILLAVGLTVQGVYHGYANFLDDAFFAVPALLIAIGAIIFFVAFFGCCGAIKENYCMVMTFSVLLVIVFILELAAGISGYVLRNQTFDLVRSTLKGTMDQYQDLDKHLYVATIWDEVQRDFSCCGLDNATDWMEPLNKTIPLSCCSIPIGTVHEFVCDKASNTLFQAGCVDAFGNFIKAHAVSLGAAGISLAVIQFFGIFVACFIARKIKQQQGHSSF